MPGRTATSRPGEYVYVVRESAQSWRELLIDIKQRGLEIAPDLAVGDGALGFWKAIEEVFPGARHQRCWVHKTANVLNKVALSVQINMKADLHEIYGAPTRAAAEAAIDVFVDKYSAKYDKAVACLTKDREALLAFFDRSSLISFYSRGPCALSFIPTI